MFGDVDHPGIGALLTPASPLRFPTDPPYPPARRRCSARTPTRSSTTCSACRPPRSAACTTTASGRRAPTSVGREPEPLARRRRLQPSARATIDPEHARALAACLDADPAGARHGHAPAAVALGVLPPRGADRRARAPTATRSGAPRWRRSRSACGSAAACRSTRPLRLGHDAAQRVEPRSCGADAKDGGSGRFWLVTVGHEITPGRTRCASRRRQDLVFREARDEPGSRPRPRRPTGAGDRPPIGWRSWSPTPCCCSASPPSPTTRTASTTTSRTPPGSRGTPTSWCTARSPRSSSPSSRGDARPIAAGALVPRPRAAVRRPPVLAHGWRARLPGRHDRVSQRPRGRDDPRCRARGVAVESIDLVPLNRVGLWTFALAGMQYSELRDVAAEVAARPTILTTDGEFHTIRRQLDRLAEEGVRVEKVAARPVGDARRTARPLYRPRHRWRAGVVGPLRDGGDRGRSRSDCRRVRAT